MQEGVIAGHAAIHPKTARLDAVGGHSFEQVAGLVHRTVQRCPGNLGATGTAGEAGQCAPSLGVPIGCAKTGEGRDQIDAAVGVGALGQGLDLGCLGDQAQPVTQPLHRRTG